MSERPAPAPHSSVAVDARRATLFGVALFLFIPVVLVLFVAHPRPVGASVAAGVLLMLGHRFLARPYMLATRPLKCVWCNRHFSNVPGEAAEGALAVRLADGGATPLEIRACAAHVERTQRYFAWLAAWKLLLRLGIGLPLGLLLGCLVAFSAGLGDWTAEATALFRLSVGVSVQIAALGPWLGRPREASAAAFPVHNFYLLGIRNILWIFRLVGLWWIYAGASFWWS